MQAQHYLNNARSSSIPAKFGFGKLNFIRLEIIIYPTIITFLLNLHQSFEWKTPVTAPAPSPKTSNRSPIRSYTDSQTVQCPIRQKKNFSKSLTKGRLFSYRKVLFENKIYQSRFTEANYLQNDATNLSFFLLLFALRYVSLDVLYGPLY